MKQPVSVRKASRIPEPVVIRRLCDGRRYTLVDALTGAQLGYFYALGRQEVGVPVGFRLEIDATPSYGTPESSSAYPSAP